MSSAAAKIALSDLAGTGVLLVGHGTRSELGRVQCETLARQIGAGLEPQGVPVELAYLELAQPTIEEATLRLVKRGAEQLVVAPLLLFAAGHAKEDIPAAVKNALGAVGHKDMLVVQTEPLGLQEPVIELAAELFQSAADPLFSPRETLLVLVGRGSRDEQATEQLRQLGSIVCERLNLGGTEVGFLAMAEPDTGTVLRAARETRFRQVVVQPHLLFHGELLSRLQREVSAAGAESPLQSWRMSKILGERNETSGLCSPALVRILLQGIELAGNTFRDTVRA